MFFAHCIQSHPMRVANKNNPIENRIHHRLGFRNCRVEAISTGNSRMRSKTAAIPRHKVVPD